MNTTRWGIAAVAAASVAIANPALAQAQPQDLDWTDCSDYLDVQGQQVPDDVDWDCTQVPVPVDYSDPDGRTIDVSVSRIRAQDPSADRGMLFGNPGGPGEQALDFWLPAATGTGPAARLHQNYDLIAVEPRGLSYGGGVACDAPVTAVLDPAEAYRACMEADPELVQSLTTENTARDMETVREALDGDDGAGGAADAGAADAGDGIDYLGYSYGTYLGATYATLYPQQSDRFVLDSAVNPNWVWNEQAARQAEARKQRTDRMFAWIAEHDDTYHLGDTPLKVFHTWKGITDEEIGGSLNLTPPDAQMGDLPGYLRPVGEPVLDVVNATARPRARVEGAYRHLAGQDRGHTTTGLSGTTIAADSTRQMWPIVAQRMQDIEEYGPGVAQLEGPLGTPPQLTTGDVLFTAVTCNENPDAGDPAQAALADFNKATGGNAFDIMAQEARGGQNCQGWPASSTPVPLDGSQLEHKPLVLQSRNDAITPYPGGVAMAKAMDGVLVTIQGGDHGVFDNGNKAVDRLVTDYLVDGVTPQAQTLPETPIRTPLEMPQPDADPVQEAAGQAADDAQQAMSRAQSVVQEGYSAAAEAADDAVAGAAQAVSAVAQQVSDGVSEAAGSPSPAEDRGAAAADGAVEGAAAGADAGTAAGAAAGADAADAGDPVAAAADAVVDAAGQVGDAVTQAVTDAVDQAGAVLGTQQ